MAATNDQTVHPNTPDWFLPYKKDNEKQHGDLLAAIEKNSSDIRELRAEMRQMRSDLPAQVVEGMKSYLSSGGGNAYSHDPRE